MISTIGKAYEYKGGVVIKTTRPPAENLGDEVTVLWHDVRMISPEQRRKAWALVGEISRYSGYLTAADKSQVNNDLKRQFLIDRLDELTAEAIKRFSLSDVDMTTARLYITYLTDFIIEHEIPTKEPLIELCDDIHAYLYGCLKHKRCAVCGRHAELHHIDRVGMGRNRDWIDHTGMRCLPLCRAHHMEVESPGMGDKAFMEKYHLEPYVIDAEVVKWYGLGRRKQGQCRKEQ